VRAYETLSEAVNALQQRGYTYNFNVRNTDEEEGLDSHLQPKDFEIDEILRFEGMNDPGGSNILFAISAKHQNIKGLLVNAYGAYSDTYSARVNSATEFAYGFIH
jgi:hypothetical protein